MPAFSAFVDQASARVVQDLRALDIDMANPGHARIVGAFAVYLMNRGWERAGTKQPDTLHEFLLAHSAHCAVLHGVSLAVVQKHGGADADSA